MYIRIKNPRTSLLCLRILRPLILDNISKLSWWNASSLQISMYAYFARTRRVKVDADPWFFINLESLFKDILIQPLFHVTNWNTSHLVKQRTLVVKRTLFPLVLFKLNQASLHIGNFVFLYQCPLELKVADVVGHFQLTFCSILAILVKKSALFSWEHMIAFTYLFWIETLSMSPDDERKYSKRSGSSQGKHAINVWLAACRSISCLSIFSK